MLVGHTFSHRASFPLLHRAERIRPMCHWIRVYIALFRHAHEPVALFKHVQRNARCRRSFLRSRGAFARGDGLRLELKKRW